MNIFAGIAQNNHYETIHEAVSALVERAQNQSLLGRRTSWSLVELELDQEDYIWLCGWVGALTPGVVQGCLEQGQWKRFETAMGECSEVVGIGILLFLFSVEVVRRKASERVLWSVVSRSEFGEETRKVLFAQNHPTRLFKDAIELAARWLKLRHVFGIEGLQSWYDTLYLQLGFTHAGFHNRLPEWLVGHYPTFAMQQLLNGPMQSESFQVLWQLLGMYRRNQITDTQVQRRLRENAWILQEWIPELMQQARARPQLSPVSAAYVGTVSEIAFQEEAFLSAPELSWDTFGEPIFTCYCLPTMLFALSDPTYHIHIGGRIASQLQRTADGTYQAHPIKWTIPVTTPLLMASIVAMDGSVVQSQLLQLWDQGEDISAFSFNGKMFDPWDKVMSTKTRYYLLLAADLEIQPRPTYWYHINVQTTLYMLAPDWPAETQVMLEGKVLWQPLLISTHRPSSSLTSEAIQVGLYEPLPPLVFQKPFRVTVEHPEQYELLYIRLAGQAVDFDVHTRRQAVTRPILLQPQMFALKTLVCLDFSLGFQQRDTWVIERVSSRLDLSVSGVTVLEQDGWRVLEPDRPLNLAQIQWKPLRFYLQDIASWSLFEGTTWVDTAWQVPRPLQACAGFGAPLKLQKSIYNSNAVERTLWLAKQVINTGCVGEIVIVDEGTEMAASSVEIQLLHPIAPEKLHTVIWWDHSGAYYVLQPERYEIKTEEASWLVTLPAECTQPIAVGIAYEGEWLGAWFSDNWTDVYDVEVSGVGIFQLAALLRWFHLPLLDKDLFGYSKHFAYEYTHEVLPTWLGQRALPGLNFTDGDEGWLAVVRSIYFDWKPTRDVGKLIMNIAELPGVDSLPDNVARNLVGVLGRVNPILMARVIGAWIEYICLPQWGRQSCVALLRGLYYELAEVSNKLALVEKKRQLLQDLTGVMNVDSAFIEKSLLEKGLRLFQGNKLDVIPGRNIAIAMHIEPFRRLLSVYLLEYINEQIEKRGRK